MKCDTCELPDPESNPYCFCVKPETGTLAELGVQPGDVVKWMKSGVMRKIGYIIDGRYYDDDPKTTDEDYLLADYPYWSIISRANQPDAAPKTFGEMTDAEKGVLYVADRYYGKQIQKLVYGTKPDGYWCDTDFDDPQDEHFYRIKPEPEKGTVTLYGGPDDQLSPPWRHNLSGPYSITIPTEDGKPIPGTYRSEAGDELIVGEV